MSDEPHGRDGESDSRRVALDEIVVAELARGRSYEEAGAAAGWSSKTVQRRMTDSSFRRRVTELRATRAAELAGRLVHSGSDAINTIAEECRSGERAADRLRAAGMLLGMGLRYRQSSELEERIRLVEQHLGLADGPSFTEEHGGDAAGDVVEGH